MQVWLFSKASCIDSVNNSIRTTTASWMHSRMTMRESVTRHPASCLPVAVCSVHDAENCAELKHTELGIYVSLLSV